MKTIIALLPACVLLSSCMMPLLPVTPRNPGADVAVPVHFRSAAPHVMGRINGRGAVPLLLDTGAVMSVFEPEVASHAGLMPSGERAVRIRGVHGTTSATRAVMHTLEIGSWRGTNIPCLVRGSSSFRPGGLGSALLGMDHFRRHCSFLTIDYRSGGVEIGFSRSFQPSSMRASRTPLRWVSGLPVIRVSSGGASWDAVVDTGSSWGIVIDQSTAARLGHARGGYSLGDRLVLMGVGGSVRADQAGARIIRGPQASLCGENHPAAEFYVMPGPKRIGSRFWAGARLTLDFRNGLLWVER